MGLESVGDLPLKEILSKLGPKHTAIVACFNRGLRNIASEDSLWRKFCNDELGLHSPVNLYGNSLPSFKETYQAWRESFNRYPWPLVIRVKRCCDRLKNWLTINLPEAKATLRKGASEADIQKLEEILKVKLPLPTRILYRLCDGQECSAYDSDCPVGLGLIGGYCFNDRSVNVCLFPLRQIIKGTMEIARHGLSFNSRSKYIVVAGSLIPGYKFFFLNCTDGQLYVGTSNFLPDGEMLPCVPNNLINLQNASSDQQQDAMLLWLEEHARRLENGIIKIRKEGNIRSINLFPEKPPLCSTAITNGVRVRASSVFIPEAANLQDHSEKYLFAYSIRMSLMPEGCITGGMNISSCQLHRRHWVICANDVVVSDINGEGVIGMSPLLRPGEEEFVYESCTPLPTSSGSVRGSFTFVPGRLGDPKDGPFEAEVAEFSLSRPDYIF
ncbi:F-box protein SKIP16-like [Mangifera indica]|uniref:F-box protein SKIP16-like n=1 Tax=Mangifera indica TaxID=29780 RepID=UPI001CFAFF3B|nr:F-box protein SKIP16-like [Mangifera indica]XP_044498606.1 F-box protein SKIP16-like [Mangifera indica]XP_044498607.1 F-box protein SKIP16-like [Mangifera indica]XP_044498608.1 F-box protein SKIP16-like [Mangifera indica]XP_044498609.1 F-box protein SKIP16-like [Mangifera indica]